MYHNLIALRNPRQHFSNTLGGHIKQQTFTPPQKKTQNVKDVALNRPEKNTVYSMTGERRQSTTLSDLSWEHVPWVTQIFTTLHMSVNDHESSRSTDFGVTNTF